MVKIMHFSDTHLGAREYSMEEREEDIYESFREAIDIAIEERVDLVVHSGDLFDSWSPSNRALTEFRNALLKLGSRNIQFYTVLGDHDRPKRSDLPSARIFDFLGVHLLGADGYQSRELDFDGEKILLAGISNMKGLRAKELPPNYEIAENEAKKYRSSILISHQAIYPYFPFKDECEGDRRELPGDFSYLAFGHIHDFLLKREITSFSYAGSTDLLSTREIPKFLKNGKGVNIVSITRGNVEFSRRRLNSVRYQYDVKSTQDDYLKILGAIADKKRPNSKKPIVTLTIVGEANYDDIVKQVKRIDNLTIRKPVRFEKESKATKSYVQSKMTSGIRDYLVRYFDSEEKADLTMKVMHSLNAEDSGEAYRMILKELGLDFMVDI